MRFKSLDEWLAWQESLNPKEIDLGLERVSRVLHQAGLKNTFDCPLITVAGTNGKGSVVAMLEAIAIAAGLKVCSYTSPHIFHYNERIKINAQPVDDAVLCESFQRIDETRAKLPLTYFEFGTLAAIDIFHRQQAGLVILEVGLGGRLDAVNIMDADVSVISSIDIDHVDWLGDNRELIAYEKAGIFRMQQPVICGEYDAPLSLISEAEKKQCQLLLSGRDYEVASDHAKNQDWWTLSSTYGDLAGLPVPNLIGEFQKNNAATAIMAFQTLLESKKLTLEADFFSVLTKALVAINLYGRFQKVNLKPLVYVDVAHNPQAALALSSQLKKRQWQSVSGKTWAIVAMLADKDITGVLSKLVDDVDIWCFSGLEISHRGQSVTSLYQGLPGSLFIHEKPLMTQQNQQDLALNQCTILSETVLLAETVKTACNLLLSKAAEDDRIVIFGSFYTVAEAMQFFSDNNVYI
ncbi:MAG: folylpolyglutamate synthase/dihydrofolate synthase family protein [Gammaproteobacteria bacterium]|nr:folylpolyglutamate synthase/dihydrofolate synthase family protein [Gammaproteobacteria bacterium]